MGDSKKEKPRVGKLSPMEIAVSGAVADVVKFFTYLDVARGIVPYQDAKAGERLKAYTEMEVIKNKYPGNPTLANKLDEAEKFVRRYKPRKTK